MNPIYILVAIILIKQFLKPNKMNILLDFVKAQEGGLSRSIYDSAKSTMCPTRHTDGHFYHTNAGVTYKTWVGVFGKERDHEFLNMSEENWKKIVSKYFKISGADKVTNYANSSFIFLMGWGSGPETAVIQVKGVLNSKFGQKLPLNYKLTPEYIFAVNSVNQRQLFEALIARREQFFINLAKKRPSDQKNLKGWLNRLKQAYKTFLPYA